MRDPLLKSNDLGFLLSKSNLFTLDSPYFSFPRARNPQSDFCRPDLWERLTI